MSGSPEQSEAQILQRIEGVLSPPNERRKQAPQEAGGDRQAPQEALNDEDNALSLEDEDFDQDEDDADASDGQSEDESQDEGSSDEEGTASEGDADEGDLDLAAKVTVTIDGKTEEVTLKEVIDGYQRTVDYTRKTQVLAEERRAVQQEREAVVQERTTYAQLLPALMQQIQAGMPQQPDWEKLYNEDPLEYVRQKDVWNENMSKLNALAEEQKRVIAYHQQESIRAQQEMVAEAFKQLPVLNPRWKDPNVYKQDVGKLREYAQKLGYTVEEVNQAYDPRAIVALDKARRYDELVAKQKKLRPNVTVTEPARNPVARRPDNTVNTKFRRAKQRLRQTGRDGDAVAAISLLLEREQR